MKSASMPWTGRFSHSPCPCRSDKPAYNCCWRGNGRWEKVPVGIIDVDKTDFTHDRCYLSPTDNCGTKITKEHFISRNILERITTSTLKFENAKHFFGGKSTVEIGIDAFSAKVLCDAHNSALSALDTEAGSAFSKIEDLYLDIKRISEAERVFRSFYLSSGIDVERWMVKVYCGLVAAAKIRGLRGTIVHRDSLHCLFDSLMGGSALDSPLGLYMHSFVGQTRKSGGFTFGTIQLTDGSDGVGGLMLSLGVMNLVLVTSPGFGQTFKDPNWYRHPTVLFNVKQRGCRVAYLFTY
ncbi:MAG: hypothetical protein ACLQVL_28050 [Terriglobia bacterium]